MNIPTNCIAALSKFILLLLVALVFIFQTEEEDEKTSTVETRFGSKSPTTEADIADHMKRYDLIKRGLDLISKNTTQIEKLNQKNIKSASEKARKQIMSELDQIMNTSKQHATMIKKTLDEIKAENTAFSKTHKDSSAKVQMRNNLYQTHIRRFHQVMNSYNAAADAFKSEMRKRSKREIKMVSANLTDEQVDAIVDSGKANDVVKQALISDNMQDIVLHIEERHLDILKLEQQVLEIYELFRDLATLVDLQQESLDVIENRIMNAKNYTEKAEVELNAAEDYQKKARKRRCCLLLILLVVLLVILLPILGTKLNSF